ncbi:N-acyl homoserine lactonase family protein [Rhizohabitans arisaemae]|uniref:N-acyl homoserine lactonase family protein n=1 Tax=Rhizohabitans arisaemae TaxID=2720610 RepID=UPI0024B1167E|nr:N-acyl homoserine lactonase family protein [Rhizohabitans arisaemae]
MILHPLRVGTVRATGGPVAAYLIRTGSGNVLVDTGYPAELGGQADGPIRVAEGEDVVSRLAALGFAPADVAHVVCSHFDPDHAGNHGAFPDAEFWVQDGHYRVATSGTVPRIERFRKYWDLPELRYRRVTGDHTLLPGIELIESGGHVPGHQSVLVRLPTRPVLLAVDAIPTAAALDPERRPVYPFDLDEAAVRAATARLVKLAESENALIVHGHDPVQWETLPATLS